MSSTALVARSRPPASLSRSMLALGAIISCFSAFSLFAMKGSMSGPSRTEDFLLLAFGAAIVASPFVARSGRLWAQILSRAVLLQLTLFGGLVMVQNVFFRADSGELFGGTLLMMAGLLPLAVLGRRGLSLRSPSFQPSAFGATLLASLVFGLADTWALLFYALMEGGSVPMLLSAGLMSTALHGLYRLKVWGLMVCVAANLLIAGLALSGFFGLPDVLTYGLAGTAAIQLLLPLPLIRAMLKRT